MAWRSPFLQSPFKHVPVVPSWVFPRFSERQHFLNQIAGLEARLQAQTSAGKDLRGAAAAFASGGVKGPQLLGQPQALDDQQWSRLQLVAGSPPPRVGQAEKRRPTVPAVTQRFESALAHVEREAEEDLLPVQEPVDQLAATSSDPLRQILVAQLRQNQMLLQKLAPKHADPVLGALAGSDNVSGGGSNVKGCIAREAFQKAVTDLPRVGVLARQQALKELGIDPSKEDASLMRRYFERRVPLAEHRLLALVGMMLAETWSTAFESGDQIFMGAIAKLLIFTEQAALDNGRTQLAWLLTGFPDPPMHMLMSARKRPGLEPFARLCPPTWVSANLSYLKDLDYLESRLQTVGKNKPGKGNQPDEDPDAAPSSRPKAKAKPKSRGKGKDAPPAASTDPSAA